MARTCITSVASIAPRNGGRRLGGMIVPAAQEGHVALVNDAQAFESEQVVHFADVLRTTAHQRSQSAGGYHFYIVTEFGDQALENAVDQTEVPVVQTGLQAVHRVGGQYARRLTNIDAGKSGGALK